MASSAHRFAFFCFLPADALSPPSSALVGRCSPLVVPSAGRKWYGLEEAEQHARTLARRVHKQAATRAKASATASGAKARTQILSLRVLAAHAHHEKVVELLDLLEVGRLVCQEFEARPIVSNLELELPVAVPIFHDIPCLQTISFG